MSAFPTHMSGWTARRGIITKRNIGARRRQYWLAMNKFKLETGKHCNNETYGTTSYKGEHGRSLKFVKPRNATCLFLEAWSLLCPMPCPTDAGSMACTRPFLSQGPGAWLLVLCNKGCCLPQKAFGLQGYKWFGPAWWGCGHESQASREGWVTRNLKLTQITVLALATGKWHILRKKKLD